MNYKYIVGKCNYEGRGDVNLAEVTWSLKDGRFSAQAGIWEKNLRDYITCGQCLDEVQKFFPNDPLLNKIVEIWSKWHLNDMTAGSPAQEQFLAGKGNVPYDQAVEMLSAAGLNPDQSYLHEGKAYKYGSAWLTRTLPSDVVAEIESWSTQSGVTKD